MTESVRAVHAAWRASPRRDVFEEWLRTFASLYGKRFSEPGPAEKDALRRLYGEGDFHELLFSVHTCFARAAGARAASDWPFHWFDGELSLPALPPAGDAFKTLYHALVPRKLRHALGEYYTPDWLAGVLLDEMEYHGDPRARLLDPACGSGTFLILAIERARRQAAACGMSLPETAARILDNIWGFEVNPLAVLAARANYRLALRDLLDDGGAIDPPVLRADAILAPPDTGAFDFIAGNPPWVRWDHLPESYREATLPLWKQHGLFSLRGFQARLGAGKKDLSMLFTYAACDHYLRNGGTLGFLITQEVLKSKGAGEGFRRFRLGPDGAPLRVVKAHDFSRLQPFDGAVNKTAAIILTKGERTEYPVPYTVWTRQGASLEKSEYLARPLGSEQGPWQTVPRDRAEAPSLRGENPYRAMLGANANPYGVFWVQVQRRLSSGLVRVRNLPELGQRPIPAVTAVIEDHLVYPALRGSDITRWHAQPGVSILVTQDPRTRNGYPERTLRERWPRTLRYVSRFRAELLRRALYRKYHAEAGNPYYSQFNIAPETFSPFKVVWKRMSNDLSAAVISKSRGPLGNKIVVPLETTAFIAASCRREAHYLCAVLNSQPVREFVRSFSAAGRGFGTPSVISHIRIPKFDAGNSLHRRLAELSERLHAQAAPELEAELAEIALHLA